MNVGVIGYELEGEATGVGRYLAGLLGGVQGLGLTWRWYIFLHGASTPASLPDHAAFHVVRGHPRLSSRVLWEQLELPRLMQRYPLDLIFSPGYSLPPGSRIPTVMSLHDLAFEVCPQEFGWRERWRRRFLARRGARRATRLLTATHAIRRQVSEAYSLTPEGIGVVPIAVGDNFRHDGTPETEGHEVEKRFGMTRPYILFLGTLLERRCLELLIEVFRQLALDRPELQLVFAGANRLRDRESFTRLLEGGCVANRVLELGYVSDEWVPALYRQAEASFYLSTYEGAGLPPLESLTVGTPAVVGPGLFLDEVWPEYPYRSPSLEVGPVLATARRALDDAASGSVVGELASRHLSGLRWSSSATRWVGELERAVQR